MSDAGGQDGQDGRDHPDDLENAIALLAMSGRFPGARDLAEFWENLRQGVESVRPLKEDELLAAGVLPATLADPRYVRSAGVVDEIDLFDAPFFGYSAREAALLDPQQRLFLECAWEALEAAGYDAQRIAGPVGVYGGVGPNSYYFFHLYSRHGLLNDPAGVQGFIGGDKDFFCTRISYELGLRGPSLGVQTACSSSLVAVHLACQSLWNGECDMALAGGASLKVPRMGYFHLPGGILSPDGHCRAFDAEAAGSVPGSGVGVVLLKRLDDALADGDPIRAVIRGSAVNNDGALRVGFSAPGVEGQSAVIAEALALARVDPESIGYVEAHGTGTALGDPIEMAALTRAFRPGTGRKGFCAVGSVKTNIGHLDAASGVAGLIKTALALERREIPPSLHLRTPNPAIDFAESPFYVNTSLAAWETAGAPRRAGVSSFGLGGTNAHVVLEEAPEPEPSGPSRSWQLVLVSAATRSALETATDRLAAHLEEHPEQPLPDVAWTLQAGRRTMDWRRAVVCRDAAEARRALVERDPVRLHEAHGERTDRGVTFLLPGLGDHYLGMARGLYDGEPVFREEIDRCAGILEPWLGIDLRQALWPGERDGMKSQSARGGVDLKAMLDRGARSTSPLERTAVAMPALLAVEISLARLWRSWGIVPRALLGYSLGEYAAACLAGVISPEDVLKVVALRARAIEALPVGEMLAVPLPETETVKLLDLSPALSLAAIHGPDLCVVAGPVSAAVEFASLLAERGTPGRRVAASHAFHTPHLQPAADELRWLLAGIELRAPKIPYVSNVTGTWVTAEQATDPAFWVRQMLEPVRFAEGLACLTETTGTAAEPGRVFLEVGPGQSLSSVALRAGGVGTVALPSLRPAWERLPDQELALATLGRLWLAGVPIDWNGFRGDERRRRVSLPTYPFERKRYWVETASEAGAGAPVEAAAATTVHARPGLSTPYVAPATELEETLAAIWQELLGISPVGVHDSFFDLGGHSLLATQLLARISARCGVEILLKDLFEAPTIAALAPRLSEETMVSEPALPRRPLADRAPLSFAQQRLWFIDRLAPGNAAYNNPVALRLRGPLDEGILAAALTEIHRRHEILRTTFPSENGEPMQRIGTPGPVEIGRLEGAVWDAVAAPFDLAARPAVRHLLARLGEDDHLFVTVMHHILWDEWSQGLYVRELAALYQAFRAGLPSPLPELPAQYGDWAAWQRDTLSGGILDTQLAYWKARLEGAPRLLALPTDRPRPAAQTFRGATREFIASGELTRTLHDVAQRHGVTLFMTVLAAFQALLGRYSGQDDLMVGTGTGGRDRVEAESLIGCFINVLPLRADLAGPVSFGELLERTREGTLGAFAHQDLPFEMLVDALKVERDPSANPLAQVMLVFLNVPPVRVRLDGDLEAEGVRIDRECAQFDLCLYLGEERGFLAGHLEYNVDLFDAATVDRLLGHFRNLLERAAADPSRPMAEIPLLSEAEHLQAVDGWNATAEDFPRDACLHELFEARAAGAPQAPALVCGNLTLTYGELERRANALACHLIRLGARRGGRIGVSLERAPEVAVSLLAVLKAGCAYVPLDPEYPEDRLAFMLESADVRLLVTQERLAGRFAGCGEGRLRVVPVDGWSKGRSRPPAPAVSPDDLVYVIFTSGSTGRPKGVMLDHRGRVNNFTDFNRRFRIGPGDAVLAVSSLSFDMSAYDVLGTLAGGATVVLPRPEELREPASWVRLMERHRVTVWHSVPALLEMLVAQVETRSEAAESLAASLRLVLLGGDWIPVTLPDRLRSLVPGAQVVSLGGATEVSMDSTIHLVEAVDPAWTSIPYGVPMANQTAYVVGPDGGPSPVGVAGELLLGGVGVGRGYFGRPDLTAERFVPDPFAAEPGRRLYRTGDLARYRSAGGRPDGVLELLGRLDHQVKIRGFRVELGEIAGCLRQHPAVGEAVVLAPEDRSAGPSGERRIVAWIVPAPGHEIDEPEVRAFVRGRLPAYMVPSAFVVLESLPLTPNRKLDRKALPIPRAAMEEERSLQPHTPPRTAVEQVLAEIWKRVLGLPRIGALDSFFDLGGHSLSATRVVTQVQDIFPLEVPLRTLFERPTLAELAARLEELGAAEGVDVAGIAEVFLEVQDLKDDEVRRLLAWDRLDVAP